jgi:glucose-1-phosphate thymidylyltransferase
LKAIIPAAGIGTRLRPHTYTLPKALLYVAGKPIIAHILDDIVPLKPSRFVLVVGYKGELIETFVKQHYPELPVDFVFQEERRGIGHAVDLTRNVANGDEPLLIVLGDTIIKTDLKKAVSAKTNVLGVKEVDDPRRFGVCEVKGDRITRLVEKPADPPPTWRCGAVLPAARRVLFDAINHNIEANITTNNEYQITDALQLMIERGTSAVRDRRVVDCGNPEAMLGNHRKLLLGAPAKQIEARS